MEEEQERFQCEGCLGYFDECDIEQPVICKECLDKAAGFDSADRERKMLLKAAKDIRSLLERGSTLPTMCENIGKSIGILNVVIPDCSKKEGQK